MSDPDLELLIRRETRRQSREQIALEIDAMKPNPPVWTDIEPLLDEAIDKDGQRFDLGLSKLPGIAGEYEITFGPQTESPLDEDTRRMLVSILAQHRKATGPHDQNNDRAYSLLNHR